MIKKLKHETINCCSDDTLLVAYAQEEGVRIQLVERIPLGANGKLHLVQEREGNGFKTLEEYDESGKKK